MAMIIDTHCHYNLEPLLSGKGSEDFGLTTTKNWQSHWQTAQQHGVVATINVGSSLSSSQKALELSQQEEKFFAAIAVHPLKYVSLIKNYLKNHQNITQVEREINTHLVSLEAMIQQNPSRLVAIGETGLDYFEIPDKGDKRTWIIAAQQASFKQHLALAKKYHLPVIIHVRDKTGQTQAYFNTLAIIKEHFQNGQNFVLHCISGPVDYLQQALKLGAYIGVAGNVTYPQAEQIRQLVKACPADRLLVETDAPYLAPGESKGQICEPWQISQTVQYLQENLAIKPEQLFENSLKVWNRLQ